MFNLKWLRMELVQYDIFGQPQISILELLPLFQMCWHVIVAESTSVSLLQTRSQWLRLFLSRLTPAVAVVASVSGWGQSLGPQGGQDPLCRLGQRTKAQAAAQASVPLHLVSCVFDPRDQCEGEKTLMIANHDDQSMYWMQTGLCSNYLYVE